MIAAEEGFAELGRRYYERGYSIFPVEGKTAVPPWKRFQRRQPYLHEVIEWGRRFPLAGLALPFGPQNNGLVAIDNDFDDPADAAKVNEIVNEVLGQSPIIRVGRWPRTLRVYKGSRVVNANLGKVEILARGRYGVLHGIHPGTNEPYRHVGNRCLIDLTPTDLPSIAPRQVKALLSELVAARLVAPPGRGNGLRSGATGLTLREALDGVPVGQRHKAMMCIAYAYRGFGRSLNDALKAASIAAERCTPPYPLRKARAAVLWVYNHLPPEKPFDLVPSVLRVAYARATQAPFPVGSGSLRYREFLALCLDLQQFRGDLPIALPQKHLARLFNCSQQGAGTLIGKAIGEGHLVVANDEYEVGRKSKTYHLVTNNGPTTTCTNSNR